ncbi:MAG: hypothetical protein EGR74_10230 [Ruminiclostridium sp.]|nr:hypothetical protein [Ruminiclostridium sp.]
MRFKHRFQLVEKVCFSKSASLQSLSPLGHSDGFASCKARCVLISASLPKTPFPGKGAILLGLPPLDPVGDFASATPFLNKQEVFRQTKKSMRFKHRFFIKLFIT